MNKQDAQIHLGHDLGRIAGVAGAHRRDVLAYLEIVQEARSVNREHVAQEKLDAIRGFLVPRACSDLRKRIAGCEELLAIMTSA